MDFPINRLTIWFLARCEPAVRIGSSRSGENAKITDEKFVSESLMLKSYGNVTKYRHSEWECCNIYL